jgi:enterochelin esterase family protein
VKLLKLAALLLACAPLARAQDMPLLDLLIPGEGWQIVAENLGFADAPCSDVAGNFYYSDMKAPAIFRVGLDGKTTKLIDELASGLKFGPDGRLYACQGAKKRLIAIDLATGKIDVIAENVQPNDLAVSRAGHIYFTETGKHQVTWVHAKTHEVKPADTGIAGPNGIALSPDQGTLAVSDSRGANAYTFRVEPDGSLSAKEPYMTLRLPIDPNGTFERQSPPPYKPASSGDGMTTDAAGRYYITSAVGLQVFDPTGRLCGVIDRPQVDKPFTSCALSGENRSYLYATNGDKIFRRKVKAEGVIWHK